MRCVAYGSCSNCYRPNQHYDECAAQGRLDTASGMSDRLHYFLRCLSIGRWDRNCASNGRSCRKASPFESMPISRCRGTHHLQPGRFRPPRNCPSGISGLLPLHCRPPHAETREYDRPLGDIDSPSPASGVDLLLVSCCGTGHKSEIRDDLVVQPD